MSKPKLDVTNEMLVTDALFRLQAMQNILVRKGIITSEEFNMEVQVVSKTILKSILEAAKVPGDLDRLVEDLDFLNKNKE